MEEKADIKVGFFMPEITEIALKTRVYVDGYNLYYGCLKYTSFKWLDLYKLFFNHIIPTSSHFELNQDTFSLRFFTANIVEKAASSKDSLRDQVDYHRALKFSYKEDSLKIIKGYYSVSKVYSRAVDQVEPNKYPNLCEKVETWKLEEKQTDVNIAIESLYDALTDEQLEHIIFVTNDTDIAPVMEKIKSINRDIKIGLVIPTRNKERQVNADLHKNADWTREHILDDELNSAQLPRVIKGGKKPASKPISWFGQATIVDEIFDVLLPVLSSRNNCWKWLESDKPDINGLPDLSSPPIKLLDDESSAKDVLIHAKAFAEYKINRKSVSKA